MWNSIWKHVALKFSELLLKIKYRNNRESNQAKAGRSTRGKHLPRLRDKREEHKLPVSGRKEELSLSHADIKKNNKELLEITPCTSSTTLKKWVIPPKLKQTNNKLITE